MFFLFLSLFFLLLFLFLNFVLSLQLRNVFIQRLPLAKSTPCCCYPRQLSLGCYGGRGVQLRESCVSGFLDVDFALTGVGGGRGLLLWRRGVRRELGVVHGVRSVVGREKLVGGACRRRKPRLRPLYECLQTGRPLQPLTGAWGGSRPAH